MKNVLIYVDNYERLSFFLKISKYFEDKVVFITNKQSVFMRIPKNYNKHLITAKRLSVSDSENDPKKLETFSTIAGYHSPAAAETISIKLNMFLTALCEKIKFERVFIWNGSTTFGTVFKDFFYKRNIKMVFFEISNLDGKIFVDKEGVNAKSFLYKHPEVLDDMKVDEQLYYEWLRNYKSDKSGQVKQAKNKSTIRLEMIIDYFGYWFRGAIREDYRNPFAILKSKLSNKIIISYESANLSKPYIFFPMQVSNDSQLALNSDYDNKDVIKELSKKYKDVDIYIKVHPAEANKAFIEDIIAFATSKANIFIVGNNTKDLIVNAEKVVVINSTVGLESLILGKDVEIYGRALYSEFNDHRLKAYIQSYLVNIDYFGDKEAEFQEVMRLIDV